MRDLARVVDSMRAACEEAGVVLVTADTKVVDRGKGDKLFVTTTGLGVAPAGRTLSIAAARPGAHRGVVTQRTAIGGERIVSLLAGEQLPRIC